MEFRTHPHLKDLQCNEDGTVIKWKGKKLDIKKYTLKNGCIQKRVNFYGATHTVGKVICECWNGMRDRMDMQIKRVDGDCNNDHYTNLFWGKHGTVNLHTKRSSTSKITDADIPKLKKLIASKKYSNQQLADMYDTSIPSISRFKKRYITNES